MLVDTPSILEKYKSVLRYLSEDPVKNVSEQAMAILAQSMGME